MASSEERRERIQKVLRFPAELKSAVEGLTEEQLSTPGGEGEWSIGQVVHHVADAHMNLLVRIKLALTEENPILKPYDQEKWALLADTTQLPLAPSMSILEGVHERLGALLKSLPEEAWSRTGMHLEAGELTVDQLVATLAGHGETHLGQIAGIKAAGGS